MRLQGKTVFITAAGQGMGRASAIACANEGAKVIATDVNDDALASLSAEHPSIETHHLNVCDNDAIIAMAAKVGPIDSLFNCAGFVHHGTILDITEEDWAFSQDLLSFAIVPVLDKFIQ